MTSEQAWHYRIIPIEAENGTIQCLVDQNQDEDDIGLELEVLLGKEIELTSTAPETIQTLLSTYYRKGRTLEEKAKNVQQLATDNEKEFLSSLIEEARQLGK